MVPRKARHGHTNHTRESKRERGKGGETDSTLIGDLKRSVAVILEISADEGGDKGNYMFLIL